jgi:colanic acid/amylovoran biosynthesis glycosyltransferase
MVSNPMHIAYLMNQHPYASCTFIRREIAALEDRGVRVARFSIRTPETKLVDPADLEEVARTRYILMRGPVGMLASLMKVAAMRPGRLLAAIRLALKLGGRSGRGRLTHLAYLGEACVVWGWCRALGVTHIHAHFGTNAAMVALLCRRLGGPAYSFTVHGPEEFDRPESFGLAEKIAGAAFVVAVSSFTRSQLYRWSAHEDWSKLHVVHCGVDGSFLKTNGSAQPVPHDPRVVCVGRLGPAKGQLLLVEAAARLAAEGLKFEVVLAGDGPMRGQIEQLIRARQLDGRVRITGWLSGAQVSRELLGARALVLASFAEGLPVVAMEALALGRPVVGTYIAGTPELVEPGVSGCLVPPGCVASMTAAIRQVLESSPQRLTEMGRHGAARVAAEHDVHTEAGKLLALFEACAAPPG